MTQSDILAEVVQHYAGALAAHGPSPRGVDWKDQASHRTRHAQFLRLLEGDRDASVLDLGCGYGDFLAFLRVEGHQGPYIGYDVVQAMIDAARTQHAESGNCEFVVGAEPLSVCDYAVASGILNVRRGTDEAGWTAYVRDVIGQLARSGRKGFGFNVLSAVSDPEKRRDDLHYSDPVEMLRFCLDNYGRHVCLLQDYGLWEFTVLVRHSSQTASPKPEAP